MEYFNLHSPKIKSVEEEFKLFKYDVSKKVRLPLIDSIPKKDFFNVLEERRTRYSFNALSIEQLSSLLWYTAKIRSMQRLKKNAVWQHKIAPSAGGRHPIDILIINPSETNKIHVYDSLSHSLQELNISQEEIQRLYISVSQTVEVQQATILLFAAQVKKTLSKYENGESLIWRDSGALLSTIYFVSEAYQLSCCGLGITGEPNVSRLFREKNTLFGVGGCLVGARALE